MLKQKLGSLIMRIRRQSQDRKFLSIYVLVASLLGWSQPSEVMHSVEMASQAYMAYNPAMFEEASVKETPATEKIIKAADKALIRTQAEKMTRINQVGNALKAQTTPAEVETATCVGGCETAVKKYQDSQCTSKDSYFESQFDIFKSRGGLTEFLVSENPTLTKYMNPQCVEVSMSYFGGDVFHQCKTAQSPTGNTVARACISHRYVNLVANSFNLAAVCLTHISKETIDVAAMVTPHESGFHVNAKFPGGTDSGVGQLTNISVRDVNEHGLDKIREVLHDSKEPACRSIEREMMKSKIPINSERNLCERMSIENGNPIVNIMYSMQLLENKRERLQSLSLGTQEARRKLSGQAAEMKKIREHILTMSYNYGESYASVVNLALRSQSEPVTDAKKFKEQLKRATIELAVTNAKDDESSKAKAAAWASKKNQYGNLVEDKFNAVQKNSGAGKCLLNM